METFEIQAGDIFEIKLEKSYGYTYLKYLNVAIGEIKSGWAMMPLNVLSSEPLDISLIDNAPLFNNILGMGSIKFKGKFKQKIIGKVSQGLIWDPFITRHSRFSLTNPYDANERWWILLDANQSSIKYMPFEQIMHLSLGFTTGIKEWITILTMIWIRRNGENIKDYYSEEEFNKDPWLQFNYEYAKGVIFYPELESKFWNKPIS